jgi:hypothetical protein|tara:strand:+ start:94 stop:267 length:174 start_codon:yes stop_codon:yes gene_type:complete
VWSYSEPLEEAPKLKNLLYFFNENVDAILIDGKKQKQAKTKWFKLLVKTLDGPEHIV